MSMRLVAIDKLGAVNDEHPSLPQRIFARTVAVVLTVAKRIVQEVVYTAGEDFRHGQIRRIPEDWER